MRLMAWQIVKNSFRTMVVDIKKYIPVIISAVVLYLISYAVQISEFYLPLFYKVTFSLLELFFVWIPCFATIYKKNPIECFKKNLRTFLLLAVIYIAATGLVTFVFSVVFPPYYNSHFTSAKSIYNFVIMILSIVIKFAVIRIIKDECRALDAFLKNSEDFTVRAGKNIWLYVKIFLINLIITTAITVLTTIAESIFDVISFHIISSILNAVFSSTILILYSYIYSFIELSNYYEKVCNPINTSSE